MFNEEGVATLRVLELLPGFWSAPRILECSQDFGVAPRVLELIPGFWSFSQDFGVKCEHLFDFFFQSPLKREL